VRKQGPVVISSRMSVIRVLVVDDHGLVRAGLRALVERIAGVEVVGEASDGRDALKLVEARNPDVVLMDLAMPGLNGFETTTRIKRGSATTHVIVVSVHTDPASVLGAIDAGAAGYMSKDASVTELELALRSVTRGGTYLSPSISRHVVEDYRRRVAGEGAPADGAAPRPDTGLLARLTPRQREVLQLLAEGSSSRKIARVLDVSVKTVETHRAQMMDRLGIHDVPGLVRFAIRAGLVRIDDV
jgi:DNA-binding NarL/FixJ family response regulator